MAANGEDDNSRVEKQALEIQQKLNTKTKEDIEILKQELKNLEEFEKQFDADKTEIKNLQTKNDELKKLLEQKQEKANQLSKIQVQVSYVNQQLKIKNKESENEQIMKFDFSTKSTSVRKVNKSQSNNYTIYSVETVGQKKSQLYILRAQ